MMNFWQSISKPILGLSPMDGVTDYSYRQITAKYGQPAVTFTEFIPVEGIVRLSESLLQDFWYSSQQRPVVAQIYGNDPNLFYSATQLVCELGFDGIDINMGCPAKSVVHRGCGAGLIRTPDLAVKLITATQQAVEDWVSNGINWSVWPAINPNTARTRLEKFIEKADSLGIYDDLSQRQAIRRKIPVSVKTRIGYDKPITRDWLEVVLATKPAAVSIHGRTLKQLYSGLANWEEISLVPKLRDSVSPDTIILGNGDIHSYSEAISKIREHKLDGVLIGRGSLGNPTIFTGEELKIPKLFSILLEHAGLHQQYKGVERFVQMRKNLAWYIKGLDNAAQLRSSLVRTNNVSEVEGVLTNYLSDNNLTYEY